MEILSWNLQQLVMCVMDMRAPIRFATLTESSGFYQKYAPDFATQIIFKSIAGSLMGFR